MYSQKTALYNIAYEYEFLNKYYYIKFINQAK